jgi:hypothetical protein
LTRLIDRLMQTVPAIVGLGSRPPLPQSFSSSSSFSSSAFWSA